MNGNQDASRLDGLQEANKALQQQVDALQASLHEARQAQEAQAALLKERDDCIEELKAAQSTSSFAERVGKSMCAMKSKSLKPSVSFGDDADDDSGSDDTEGIEEELEELEGLMDEAEPDGDNEDMTDQSSKAADSRWQKLQHLKRRSQKVYKTLATIVFTKGAVANRIKDLERKLEEPKEEAMLPAGSFRASHRVAPAPSRGRAETGTEEEAQADSLVLQGALRASQEETARLRAQLVALQTTQEDSAALEAAQEERARLQTQLAEALKREAEATERASRSQEPGGEHVHPAATEDPLEARNKELEVQLAQMKHELSVSAEKRSRLEDDCENMQLELAQAAMASSLLSGRVAELQDEGEWRGSKSTDISMLYDGMAPQHTGMDASYQLGTYSSEFPALHNQDFIDGIVQPGDVQEMMLQIQSLQKQLRAARQAEREWREVAQTTWWKTFSANFCAVSRSEVPAVRSQPSVPTIRTTPPR